ncbi:MAG: hypothetical protein GWO22_30720, partial [Actinobacteria bacterium]|nr:hypothetical protein [Actinomycetota bacterium]
LGVNLPATAADGDSHTVTVQLFDSLGTPHNLDVTFTYDETNTEWDITIADPVLASDPTQVSGSVTAATRTISFAGDGTPASITAPPIEITWDDAVTTADDMLTASNTELNLDL